MSFQAEHVSVASQSPTGPHIRGLPPAEWNNTKKVFSTYRGIQQLFEAQVVRTPDRIAVEFPSSEGSRTLSYRDLNKRANVIAHQLRKLKVGADSIVGISAERSIELVIGILGIIKSGAAYVPLDPTYPRDRLSLIINDTSAPVILTQEKLAPSLRGYRSKIVSLDSEWTESGAEAFYNPSCIVSHENLAYLIYTSGSTGKPKGVAMRQGPLINLLQWQAEHLSSKADARCLQFASINFDVSFQEIFSTWSCGGTLVLISEEQRRDSKALLEFIESNRIERLFLPFVALKHLADIAEHHQLYPKALKEVITAGEQLQVTPQISTLFRNLPGCTLENQYGPSESHVVTAYRLEGPVAKWPALPPIGRPIANTQIHILNEAMQPAPIGEAGELYIGGVCLARGYLNRPELTAERFISDPFYNVANARLYKTGDLARWLPDGNIEFLGRIDHQVKIRGYRIELGEIEVLLSQHNRVQEAVAIARDTGSGDKQLVAYVVPKGGPITAAELRDFLKQRLPPYAIPALFITLPKLPLNANGKVNRLALPAPSEAELTISEQVKQPRSPLEMQLQLIFEKLLQRRPIGVDVSFFELGGDSLQALKLVVEIENATRKRIPLSILYEASTIEQLAKTIREQTGSSDFSSLVPLKPNGSKTPIFLIHTTPGDLLGYGNLIFHLDSDQPAYGLQSLGLKDAQLTHTRIEEMAAYYVSLIRGHQSHGPYLLSGWCYGGIIAFEMAHQLIEAGESVAPLLLIETPAPEPSLVNVSYYIRRVRCAASMSPSLWSTYLREKFRYYFGFKKLLEQRFKRADSDTGANAVAVDDHNRLVDQLERVYFANLNALKHYKPRPYPGKVILFNANQQDPALVHDPLYGWPAMAKGVEAHVIPGTHDTILMEPNVRVLAAKMQQYLTTI